jgi:hypothetical protein
MVGNMMEQLTVELINRTKEPVAQPHGTLYDRREYRLHVDARAADDAQDLSGGSVLLARLG